MPEAGRPTAGGQDAARGLLAQAQPSCAGQDAVADWKAAICDQGC